MSTLDEVAEQLSTVIDAIDRAAADLCACGATLDSVVDQLHAVGVHARADQASATRHEVDAHLATVASLRTGVEQMCERVAQLRGGSPGAAAAPAAGADAKPVGVTHGRRTRREGATRGLVVFRLPDNLTDAEARQALEYREAGNRLLAEGRLSPTGRVKVSGQLAREKLKAAEAERRRAQSAGEPYGEHVAAHLVDTTWTGQAEPPAGWGRHTHRVNSVLGAQSGQYPVGYKPTGFDFEDEEWQTGQPGPNSLER